ncbi:hypothetical protein AB1046_09195 [Promicromonospora sp. Populi]|uniref:hypothetical protein n=1 Tax=Promicromonospora sp. Populi TaxID=3239420 RepID=UPI0034E2C4A6
MTWPRLAVPAVLLAVLLTGCAAGAAGSPPDAAFPLVMTPATAPTTPPADTPRTIPTATPATTTTHGRWSDGSDQDSLSPFEVRYDDDALVLYPYSFCAESVCADGFDDDPPSIGSPEQIYVRVPADRYSELTVMQLSGTADDPDGTVEVEAVTEPLGDGWWLVTPSGPADSYRVTMFARGDGDMLADLLWETP